MSVQVPCGLPLHRVFALLGRLSVATALLAYLPMSSSVALVAIALPRPAAARAVVAAWEAGEAVLPLDPGAPAAELKGILAAARPTHLLDGDGRRRLPGGEPAEAGLAAVVATSGTSDAPKVVELGADAVRWSALATSAALEAGPGDRWLCCLPVHGVAGLAVVARAWHTGLPLEVHERFDPAAVRPGRRPGDPGLAGPGDAATAAGRRRRGGPVPPGPARRRAHPGRPGRRTPPAGVSAWSGPTGSPRPSAAWSTTATPWTAPRCGSTATAPRARSWSGGRCCSGATGATPTGRRPRSAAAGCAPATWGGWSPAAGSTVLGRADDLVISGGVNVHPDEVEAVLATHPAVAEAAVAGRPDPEWGQRVTAFVVPRDPASPPTLAELRAFARERLAAAKAPRELVLVPALPRSPSGKLLRRLLPDGEAHMDAGPGRDLP